MTEVMHAEGGLAEWEKTDVGYEIRDFNCLFHRLLSHDGESDVCEWHQSFLAAHTGRRRACRPVFRYCGTVLSIRSLEPVGAAKAS